VTQLLIVAGVLRINQLKHEIAKPILYAEAINSLAKTCPRGLRPPLFCPLFMSSLFSHEIGIIGGTENLLYLLKWYL